MSSLWTPSGERPIRPTSEPEAPGPRAPAGAAGGPPDDRSEDEVRAEVAEISRQILQTPASVVVANHCIGLFQLAALHLDQDKPNLGEAQLAIDALGAVVETLGPRLGEEQRPLTDALQQLRLAFVGARQNAQKGAADNSGSAG